MANESAGDSDREGMLGPYRVLDLTDERGILCGKILADLGADVIQIEPPGGSPARRIGPFYRGRAGAGQQPLLVVLRRQQAQHHPQSPRP